MRRLKEKEMAGAREGRNRERGNERERENAERKRGQKAFLTEATFRGSYCQPLSSCPDPTVCWRGSYYCP